MSLTLSEILPVGLCLATQELFDVKRYRQNFCDSLLMRSGDKSLGQYLIPLKKELNADGSQRKFLEGHKTAIISNIDKILSLVASRYDKINYKSVESIVMEGKSLIKKILFAGTFQELNSLEPVFKSKVSLPTYSLFLESTKRTQGI